MNQEEYATIWDLSSSLQRAGDQYRSEAVASRYRHQGLEERVRFLEEIRANTNQTVSGFSEIGSGDRGWPSSVILYSFLQLGNLARQVQELVDEQKRWEEGGGYPSRQSSQNFSQNSRPPSRGDPRTGEKRTHEQTLSQQHLMNDSEDSDAEVKYICFSHVRVVAQMGFARWEGASIRMLHTRADLSFISYRATSR